MSQPSVRASFSTTTMWMIVFAVIFGFLLSRPLGLLLGACLGYLIAQVLHLQDALAAVLRGQAETRSHTSESPQEQKSQQKPSWQTYADSTQSESLAAPDDPYAQAIAKLGKYKERPGAPVISQKSSQITETVKVASQPKVAEKMEEKAAPAFESGPSQPGPIDMAVAWFKRGNPLARVGVVVMFFGGAFLAKYSADAGLLPLEVRFMALALGAITLLVLGWKLRTRKRIYGQALQGGGVAGLYLTVFTAFKLFQLLPPGFALGVMVVVAVFSAFLAVYQNAIALAVLGAAGGFMAPILTSTGEGNHIALFTYYAILNFGIFTVAWFRAWQVLNLVGFVFTFGVTSSFRALAYSPEKWFSTDLFLLLFFVMYVAVSILFSIRQKPDLKGYVSGSLVFGLPVVVFGLHASLINHIEYGLAWSALGFSAFYAALGWALYLSGRQYLQLLFEAFAAMAIVFGTLVIPLAFDAQTTSAMWAVEGAGLVWLGLKQSRALAWGFGMALQFAGGLSFMVGMEDLNAVTVFMNSAFIGSLILSSSGMLTAYWMHKTKVSLADFEISTIATAFALWSAGWWLHAGLGEIHRFLPDRFLLGVGLSYLSGTALLLYLLAQRLSWQFLFQMGLCLMPVAAVGGLLVSADASRPSGLWGGVGWPFYLGVGYYLLWQLEDTAEAWFLKMRDALHVMFFWLLSVLLIWELYWWVDKNLTGIWPALVWAAVPLFMIWTCAKPLSIWPVAQHLQLYRDKAALPLVAIVLGWFVWMNFEHNGDPAPLPYLPILNPLELTQIFILMIVGYYWYGLETETQQRLWVADRRKQLGIAAAVMFVWLNTLLIRTLHHYFDVPWEIPGIVGSLLVQACLSIFWSLLGLSAVIIASRKSRREMWIVGAGLMAVVVIKLFIVDLAGTGSLARIVTFLSVGVLLLLAGYVSPLPPSQAKEEK